MTALQSEYQYRDYSHISKGSIEINSWHLLLVLCTATNPFKYETSPERMIAVGVHEYHWYRRDKIRWPALDSYQRRVFAQCVLKNHLVLKHKWGVDTEKATEKRFHRAYWLAADE